MDKFNKFAAVNIFLDPKKKRICEVDVTKEQTAKEENSVFVGPNFITMKEALAIAGGRDPSKTVDAKGLCANFSPSPDKIKDFSLNENTCERCMHSELKPKTLFFKARYSCKIGKGPDYTSPKDFN